MIEHLLLVGKCECEGEEKKNVGTLKNYHLVSMQELSYYIITSAPIKHAELFRGEERMVPTVCYYYYLMGNSLDL